jgi:hypothetical protein
MVLWKIWHPGYGVLYDEYKNIKPDRTTIEGLDVPFGLLQKNKTTVLPIAGMK